MSSPNLIILLHVGAGYINKKNKSKYKSLTKLAISNGLKAYENNKNVDEVLVEVIRTLEDSELTNSGYGSNLNIEGKVEMDCSIMKSKYNSSMPHQFIGLGSITNKKGGILPGNRVCPVLLTDKGAQYFIKEFYPELKYQNEFLVSDKALTEYEYYKQYFSNTEFEEKKQDTVGAIVFDIDQMHLVSAVSSGGILLKFPGRVGEAAIYGAGIWTEFNKINDNLVSGVACNTSGTGEAIIYNEFSKSLAKNILKDENELFSPFQKSLQGFKNDCNVNKRFIVEHQAVGSITLSFVVEIQNDKPQIKRLEFIYGHTTENMGIAYYIDNKNKTKFIISEKGPNMESHLCLINLLR